MVVTGKDKGKTGTVLKMLPKEQRLIVEGVNLRVKHQRAGKNIQKGQKVEKPTPISVSNVMIVDPKTKKPTRVRFSIEKGKKTRVTAKSQSKLA